jgi:hypothetical protein
MFSPNISWWTMPGPSRFLQRIAADMAGGKSVVIGLPPHAPAQMLESLRRQPQPGFGANSWQQLEPLALPAHLSPAEWLAQKWQLLQDKPHADGISAQELARSAGFPVGRRVVLQEMAESDWPKWVAFLDNYTNQAQQFPSPQRTVFCCVVRSPAILIHLEKLRQAHTRVHLYQNCCSRLDSLLFATEHMDGMASKPPLLQEIQQELAAILFRTDPAAAMEVIKLAVPQATDLQNIIENICQERGWTDAAFANNLPPVQEWAHGWTDTYSPHQLIWHHPGTPHTNSSQQWAEMAVWQAQARVLLPWLEQQRRKTLRNPALQAALKAHLPHTPLTPDAPRKYQVDELELGEICYLLNRINRIHWFKVIKQLDDLKYIRHELSHLRSLTWGEIERRTSS